MKYQTKNSAACDLTAAHGTVIPAGARAIIGTGIYLAHFYNEVPEGMCFLVLSRSGLAAKHGIQVLNSPGLIDGDYVDEIKVILLNTSNVSFLVRPGDRIAQLMAVNFLRLPGVEVCEETRTGGLGSTGV
jgi:dUTP pyrophosphatase